MKALILMLSFFLCVACNHLTLQRSELEAGGGSEVHQLQMASFLLGILPGGHVPPASELCPGAKVDRLTMHTGTGDALLAWVTLGIYIPYAIEYQCSKGLGARL